MGHTLRIPFGTNMENTAIWCQLTSNNLWLLCHFYANIVKKTPLSFPEKPTLYVSYDFCSNFMKLFMKILSWMCSKWGKENLKMIFMLFLNFHYNSFSITVRNSSHWTFFFQYWGFISRTPTCQASTLPHKPNPQVFFFFFFF